MKADKWTQNFNTLEYCKSQIQRILSLEEIRVVRMQTLVRWAYGHSDLSKEKWQLSDSNGGKSQSQEHNEGSGKWRYHRILGLDNSLIEKGVKESNLKGS